MKIALDATPLTVPTGGIRRYTEQLQRALAAEFPEDRFELLSPQPGRWWSTGLPRALTRDEYDLFHGTDFAVPYLPSVPAVMTLHDLSPWRPEWRDETSARVRRRTPWLLRLGLAKLVITPTEAIRRESIECFRLKPERVRVVPHGVAARFRPAQGDSPPPYLLLVGTQGQRKNTDVAIAAARAAGIELWIAGRGDWPVEPGVRNLGAVPDADLPALYSRAVAFLFPSHYEGFGLPLLEAMACGTPVIASQDAALVEVSGGAALHCGADDVQEWVEAIGAARTGRERMARAGQSRAAEFTWSRTARLTREVYEEALCRRAAR
jgi:glycosyltransferase involved in cell wall biosynthesis